MQKVIIPLISKPLINASHKEKDIIVEPKKQLNAVNRSIGKRTPPLKNETKVP